MGRHRTPIQKALWISPLLVVLLVAGCAGITPYDPPDYREEPPVNGLLTGAEGEFVIYRKADEPATGSEASKGSDETSDGKQQKMSND
jgi:hypothetical protein